MSRTLLQKLGIKAGFECSLINAPDNYFELLKEPIPNENNIYTYLPNSPVHFIHLFTNSIQELEELLPIFQNHIYQNGMIWVSWYKKSAKIPSELNEDIIRDTALALKLVDIKVCSINDQWSALKLVIRKDLRTKEIYPLSSTI